MNNKLIVVLEEGRKVMVNLVVLLIENQSRLNIEWVKRAPGDRAPFMSEPDQKVLFITAPGTSRDYLSLMRDTVQAHTEAQAGSTVAIYVDDRMAGVTMPLLPVECRFRKSDYDNLLRAWAGLPPAKPKTE